MKKRTLAIPATIAALVLATPAHAGGGGIGAIMGATLPEQLIQEMTLGDQYSTQAVQTAQQIQMVANQMKNLSVIPMELWPNISSQLASLVTLVGNAHGLSYAAANTVGAVQSQFGAPAGVLTNYGASLQTWTSNLDSQIASVLQQYGLNASSFATTQSALQGIQDASYTAAGRMQVLQAGNQISGLMVNQMQSLQSDIQAGNQAELNFMAMQAHSQTDQTNSVAPILAAPTQPGAF
ncbi:p-type conjugative transfer protein TrbJ [Burkholderiales bacterium GJ-E10]|nr:p-type conjugative transfer protein TrbJ [Burkholderiales bacterium GJ-E10]